MRYLVLLCLTVGLGLTLSLPASASTKERTPRNVLVVGDSLLDWQRIRGLSIPQVMARATGWNVANRATTGAAMINRGVAKNTRGIIPAQYREGAWDWVVINGGANDLLTKCGCSRCSRILNKIISPDASSGILVDLVKRARKDGAGVVMVGYLGNPRPNLFQGCRDEVFEMVRRQKILAKAMPNVQYLSSREVVDVNSRSTFSFDGVHPSGRSTRSIGMHLARTLVKMDVQKQR